MKRIIPYLHSSRNYSSLQEPEVVIEFVSELGETKGAIQECKTRISPLPEIPTPRRQGINKRSDRSGNPANPTTLVQTNTSKQVTSPTKRIPRCRSKGVVGSEASVLRPLASSLSLLCIDDVRNISNMGRDQMTGSTCSTEDVTSIDSISTSSVEPFPIRAWHTMETPSTEVPTDQRNKEVSPQRRERPGSKGQSSGKGHSGLKRESGQKLNQGGIVHPTKAKSRSIGTIDSSKTTKSSRARYKQESASTERKGPELLASKAPPVVGDTDIKRNVPGADLTPQLPTEPRGTRGADGRAQRRKALVGQLTRKPRGCDDPKTPPPNVAKPQKPRALDVPDSLSRKHGRTDQRRQPPSPTRSLKEVRAKRRGEPCSMQVRHDTGTEGKESDSSNCKKNESTRSGRVAPSQRRTHKPSSRKDSSGNGGQKLLLQQSVVSSSSESNLSKRKVAMARKTSSKVLQRQKSGNSSSKRSCDSSSLRESSRSTKQTRKAARFPTNESRRPRQLNGDKSSKRSWKLLTKGSLRRNSSGSHLSKNTPVSMNIFGNEVVGNDFILSQLDELAKNEAIVHLELEDFLLTRRALAIPFQLKEVLEGDARPWEGVHFVDDLLDGFAYDDLHCNRKRFLHALGGVCEQHLIPVTHSVKVHLHEGEHGYSPEKEECMIELLKKFRDDRAVTAVNMSTSSVSLKLIRALTSLLLCDDRQWDRSMTIQLGPANAASTSTHVAMKRLKQVSKSKGVMLFH